MTDADILLLLYSANEQIERAHAAAQAAGRDGCARFAREAAAQLLVSIGKLVAQRAEEQRAVCS